MTPDYFRENPDRLQAPMIQCLREWVEKCKHLHVAFVPKWSRSYTDILLIWERVLGFIEWLEKNHPDCLCEKPRDGREADE